MCCGPRSHRTWRRSCPRRIPIRGACTRRHSCERCGRCAADDGRGGHCEMAPVLVTAHRAAGKARVDFLRSERCRLDRNAFSGASRALVAPCTVLVDGKVTRSVSAARHHVRRKIRADAGRLCRRPDHGGVAAFSRVPCAAMRILHAGHAGDGARHFAAPAQPRGARAVLP